MTGVAATGGTDLSRPRLTLEGELVAAGLKNVAGIDEAGRGALAGPVVAGAVILPLEQGDLEERLAPVRDSKEMSPRAREVAFGEITEVARSWATGAAGPREVDALGLIPATRWAMIRAIRGLTLQPDYLLLDHLLLPDEMTPQTALVRGDALCLSIAAASVIAKVSRDRRMVALEKEYPGYGLAGHKGYGTAAHRSALAELGPAPIHRRSYRPVAAALG